MKKVKGITNRIVALFMSGMLVVGAVPGTVLASENQADIGQTSEITAEVPEGTDAEEVSAEAYSQDAVIQEAEASEEEAAQYYTVILDANGGYFENEWDDSIGETVEKAEIVEKQIPVGGTVAFFPVFIDQDGRSRTFAGWSLERDGELVSQAEEEYLPVDNCTLYAVWQVEDTVVGETEGQEVADEENTEQGDAVQNSEEEETKEGSSDAVTAEESPVEENIVSEANTDPNTENEQIIIPDQYAVYADEDEEETSEESSEAAVIEEETQNELIESSEEEETVREDAANGVVANGTCGAFGYDITWTLDEEGMLTISGTGRMDSWYPRNEPWESYLNQITSIVVQDGITSIGGHAFWSCSKATKVTIPDSVTYIGAGAFYSCKGLTSVIIPDGVTYIGNSAFESCSNILSVTIPVGVKTIGQSAFKDCTGLTRVTIPSSITSLESTVFCNCTSLTSVTIPDSVTSIGSHAFADCSSLTNITIPKSVRSIGTFAFGDCGSLTSINVVSDNSNYASVDGVLMDKDKTSLIQYPIGKSESSYTIPDSVTSIEADAFYNCRSLTSVTIGNSVTSIGADAFWNCYSLTSVTIGNSVTSIGLCIFVNCNNLIVYSANEYVISYCKDNNIRCNYATEFYPEIGAANVDYTHPIRIVFDKYVIGNDGYAYLYEVGKEEPVDSILLSEDYLSKYSLDFPRNNLKLVFKNIVNGRECIDSGKSYYIEIEENAIKLSDNDPNEINNDGTGETEEQVYYPFPGIYVQRWKFSTINLEYASFCNPNNNEISKDLFRHVFKAPIITNYMYNKKEYRNPGGICYGMAYISGAKKNNFGMASQFKKLYSYEYNNTEQITGGFTISDYMKMAFVYQKRDDEIQEVIDTTNQYFDIVNAIQSYKQIIIHIWKKGLTKDVRKGQHSLLPIRIVENTDSEIKVQVYDCNGVCKQYEDSRFVQKSFLSILTFKKKDGSIIGIEYFDDNKEYSGKYDCIAMTTLDDKFEQLIKSNSSLSSYEEYYEGHPLLMVRQVYDIGSHPFQYVTDIIPIFVSHGSETEETENNLYWVKGSSCEGILTEDNTISITDGYDEIEITASSGASIGFDIENNTTKIENTDASSQDYIITYTRAEDDDTMKSVVINGETSSTVNTEKTDNGILVSNEDGTPVEVEISIRENDDETSSVDVIASTNSVNISYNESNTITVTEDTDSDGSYETIIATSNEEIHHNVTFDANGGVIYLEIDDITSKEAVNAESVTKRIKKDNYAFIPSKHVQNEDSSLLLSGWALLPDGDVVIDFNESFKPDGDCTLYAVWKHGKPAGTRQYGELNQNGILDFGDVIKIQRHINAFNDTSVRTKHPDWILTGYEYEAADINHDAVINDSDYLPIQRDIAARNNEETQAEHPDWILTETFTIYSFDGIEPRPVTGITLNNSKIVLEKGKSATLTADLVPKDADDTSIAWSSSNAEVATVDVNGSVKGVSEGTATITAAACDGSGVYAACEVTVTAPIKSIEEASVTGITSKAYTGNAITQELVVKIGDTILEKDIDYTIAYSNNINAGTATVTITGKGNYTGTVSKNFTINKAAQSITAKAVTSPIAVGKATIVSIAGAKGTKSFKSSDTTIATVDSKTGKVTARKVGIVKITATSAATENYNAASKTVTIKVVPAATTSLTAANQVTGIKLTWKKVAGANGYLIYRGSTLIKTITNGNTVSFVDKKANTNGTRYVYKVVAKAATGTSRLSKSVAFYRVARPVISSLKNVSAKKMKVKWGKNAKATGYKILYSRSKTFISGNKSVTFAGASNVSKVIGNLTKGKTYYVSVRAYKIVGGKVYWSEWSAVKGVKISK